jgi:hypothetical protein
MQPMHPGVESLPEVHSIGKKPKLERYTQRGKLAGSVVCMQHCMADL